MYRNSCILCYKSCKYFLGENRGTNAQKANTRRLKEIHSASGAAKYSSFRNKTVRMYVRGATPGVVFIHNIRNPFLTRYSH